jgi:hypothetical protein
MIARDYAKVRQEALEAMQRADKEVMELSFQLGSARATLRQTEIRLQGRTLNASKDCSAMYARANIEWFELSRRISGPRQKAWSEYLKNYPDFNIRPTGIMRKAV